MCHVMDPENPAQPCRWAQWISMGLWVSQTRAKTYATRKRLKQAGNFNFSLRAKLETTTTSITIMADADYVSTGLFTMLERCWQFIRTPRRPQVSYPLRDRSNYIETFPTSMHILELRYTHTSTEINPSWTELKRKRAFRKFSYRGIELDQCVTTNLPPYPMHQQKLSKVSRMKKNP